MATTDTTTEGPYRTLALAKEAGASGVYLMVAAIDPDVVEVNRNLAAGKLMRTVEGKTGESAIEALQRMKDRSGHYIGALWEGDLAEALYRADGTNMRLLLRALSRDVIMAALVEERGSVESAERWLEPYYDRYGWD